MDAQVPSLPPLTWDIVEDPEGFSAEVGADRTLRPAEVYSFVRAAHHDHPVQVHRGDVELRAIATVDDGHLWLVVHAIGPGPCQPDLVAAAEALLRDRWRAVHEEAWRIGWQSQAS